MAYQPRSFDMTFSMLGSRADFEILVSMVVNQFAGRPCWLTLTENLTLYAVGTLEAAPSFDPLSGKGMLELSCVYGGCVSLPCGRDGRQRQRGGTVALAHDFMPVVPVITAATVTTLHRVIDDESFQKAVSAGTWEIPEMGLRHGNNTISITGEGNVTFIYRQGQL